MTIGVNLETYSEQLTLINAGLDLHMKVMAARTDGGQVFCSFDGLVWPAQGIHVAHVTPLLYLIIYWWILQLTDDIFFYNLLLCLILC